MKTYVQIGANVGKDDFQKIIESLTERSKIILIEPNTSLLEALESSYKNLKEIHEIHICNKAIALQNEITELYLYATGIGHSSLLKRKSHQQISNKVSIETITFKNLCELYSINEIEYLCVDTEGVDYEILNSINFVEVIINKIYFEIWPYNNDDLNNKYQTGNIFFEQILKPKLEKHFTFVTTLANDNVQNFLLTKK